MHPPLTDVEVRVLGALLEKQVTTPDGYPLSASALTAACNQASNREPVMRLEEDTVLQAAVALRRRGLLRAIQPAGSRVTKYEHLLADALRLDARELALLGVLLLRGAQTPGELHARTARLAEFAGLAELEATLDALVTHEPEPLVVRLPRRAGQKEVRYAHLLGGAVAATDAPGPLPPLGREPAAAALAERVATLEGTVDALRAEVAALRAQLDEFRAQFQ